MPEFCSIWDLYKELVNLASGQDPLQPRNREKGPQWLLQRVDELPGCDEIFSKTYRLTRPQYRTIWAEMAGEHWEVVSILRTAAATTRGHFCIFNQAMRKMIAFLKHFATEAAPFSGFPRDQEFKILMENFGTVVGTMSIFYDCYDCELRSKGLKEERDAGRMDFFRFDKNDPSTPLEPEVSRQLLKDRFSGRGSPGPRGKPHRLYHHPDIPCPYKDEPSPESELSPEGESSSWFSPIDAEVVENEDFGGGPASQPSTIDYSTEDSMENGTFAWTSPIFHESTLQAAYNSFNSTPIDWLTTGGAFADETFMDIGSFLAWEGYMLLPDENWLGYGM